MIKCKLHIYSGAYYMDEDVCIEVNLPCLPPINAILNCDKEELENKARSELRIANTYSDWFYGKSSNIETVKQENLEDLTFDDAIYVYSIEFNANEDYVHILLNSEPNYQTQTYPSE
jgi:hypothetical protein